jgi:hypothetical protein
VQGQVHRWAVAPRCSGHQLVASACRSVPLVVSPPGDTGHPQQHDAAPSTATLCVGPTLPCLRTLCTLLPAGQPEALLDGALDQKFRLWDAYGLLPVLCDPTRRAQPDACVVRCEVVQDIIRWGAPGERCRARESRCSQSFFVAFLPALHCSDSAAAAPANQPLLQQPHPLCCSCHTRSAAAAVSCAHSTCWMTSAAQSLHPAAPTGR